MKWLLNKKVVSIILFLFGAALMVACGGGGGGGGGGSTTPTTISLPQLSNPTIDPANANSGVAYIGQLTVYCTDTGGDILGGTIRYSYGQYLSPEVTISGWTPNATSGTIVASVNIPSQFTTNQSVITIWVWDAARNQSSPVTVPLPII